ncbi:MAG TPA: ester cyclase [Burkholderiales bacterium]
MQIGTLAIPAWVSWVGMAIAGGLCAWAFRSGLKKSSSPASNKATVRRFFAEALDGRDLDMFDELVADDCVIHRPESREPIRGLNPFKEAVGRIVQTYSEFSTTIHDLIAEDDRVACRLSHRAVNRGEWTSRLGRHDVAGKALVWSANVIFRFRGGKIVEEWVSRDELGMLIDLGVVQQAPVRSS